MIKYTKKIAGYLCPATKRKAIFATALCVFSLSLMAISGGIKPVSTTTGGEIKLPILMYHSVLDDANRQGKYVIMPEELKKDFEYIKQNGYTPILASDLINYKEKNVPLPEKPIMLTFDDGYYNNYSYLFPLLKEYNFKAVISAIGKYADDYSKAGEVMNNNYSHATWKMLKEMQDSGLVEIGNHSYYMHDWSKRHGILKNKGEDDEYYRELLTSDIIKMQEKIKTGTGKEAIIFTYPFGSVNSECRNIVEKLGFKVTLGCEEGVNTINKESTFKELKRYNRSGIANREDFFKKINKSVAK